MQFLIVDLFKPDKTMVSKKKEHIIWSGNWNNACEYVLWISWKITPI